MKGGESIGISLNFICKLTTDSIDDLGYTGYVNIYMVHSDPDLHKVKVETKTGKKSDDTQGKGSL